jgi:hypothetical protein
LGGPWREQRERGGPKFPQFQPWCQPHVGAVQQSVLDTQANDVNERLERQVDRLRLAMVMQMLMLDTCEPVRTIVLKSRTPKRA